MVKVPRFDPGSPYADLRYQTIGRYMQVTAKGHSIATDRGRVRVHRAVHYDAIGDGPHDCHWCEYPGLRWDVSQDDPSYLIVDHLDGDGFNNVRSNLVASHKWCNDNRSVIERLGIPWSTFRDRHPADRPPLRIRTTGAPTPAAVALAGSLETADPEPPAPPAPVVPVASARASRNGFVVWDDAVELDDCGDIKVDRHGNIRLVGPPEHLREKYPQLRSIPFEAFGRER